MNNHLTILRDLTYQQRFSEAIRLITQNSPKPLYKIGKIGKIGKLYIQNHSDKDRTPIRKTLYFKTEEDLYVSQGYTYLYNYTAPILLDNYAYITGDGLSYPLSILESYDFRRYFAYPK